jgi:proline dehydrogenase
MVQKNKKDNKYMLRSLLIYLSQANWMRRLVTGWGIARRVALRFVAGETLEEAIAAAKIINENGMYATMDQLGEHTETSEQAKSTAEDILTILDAIDKSGVKSGLSVKLTQIGLTLDEALCEENLAKIISHAGKYNIFVRIDMEDSECLDATMRLYWKMINEYHFENVGMVIQSYLYRSDKDVDDLLEADTRIRMVKGAYKEPAEIAYPKKKDVDEAFDRLTEMMLEHAISDDSPGVYDGGGYWPPVTAVASHDEGRVQFAIGKAESLGVPKEKLEFQMLYGIRRELQQRLTTQGYPVRIYVPFGTEWYPYFMRRLAERPANLWFFISSLLRN